MLGLRTKLAFGFGGLLLVVLVIGIQGILRVNELGQSIDVILRENYRSVIACQEMKENLERVDCGVLFVLLGYEERGRKQVQEHLGKFVAAMHVEAGNITLSGEGEAFRLLESKSSEYQRVLDDVVGSSSAVEARRQLYFSSLLPLFQSIKQAADEILRMNQQNMSDANAAGRDKATHASQHMYLLLICGVAIAFACMLLAGRWILRPLTTLTESANEIASGNLDLVVSATSDDEIGQLSRAFDAMASSLREYRRTNEAKVLSLQRATQQALESLSAAIAVIDPDGTVEAVTKAARDMFGFETGRPLRDRAPLWMVELFYDTLGARRTDTDAKRPDIVQVFVKGEERFVRPEAIPIRTALGELSGVTLILHDITQSREQDELKRGMVSTVSHQLKTPLTSIRMALYLLLDDQIGPLTPKQEELLLAAREDTERLHSIVEDLLDIARIQSGRIQMDLQGLQVAEQALNAAEAYRAQAQDRGVSIAVEVPCDLPPILADPGRLPYVFANLLSNAIRYTSPGGVVTITARADRDLVWYSVADTGAGIPPEHLPRVFEQFFRVPDQAGTSGAGLGLAIAREIVRAHGGDIRVESQLGKGSTFSFSVKALGDPEGKGHDAC